MVLLLDVLRLAGILGCRILGDGRATEDYKPCREEGPRYPLLHTRLSFL